MAAKRKGNLKTQARSSPKKTSPKKLDFEPEEIADEIANDSILKRDLEESRRKNVPAKKTPAKTPLKRSRVTKTVIEKVTEEDEDDEEEEEEGSSEESRSYVIVYKPSHSANSDFTNDDSADSGSWNPDYFNKTQKAWKKERTPERINPKRGAKQMTKRKRKHMRKYI